MKIRFKRVYENYGALALLGAIGIPIGAVVGAIDALFGRALIMITGIREANPIYFIPLLPIAGVFIAYCYYKFGGTGNKGINLIFAVGHGEEEIIPLRLIPFIMTGTWITHLFGGSAGREGVAVQIGATFSHWAGRRIPIKNASSIFLVTGMAAGFAGLFMTPLAAVLFAMEVLVAGELKYKALIPALSASFTACTVSKLLGLKKFSFDLPKVPDIDISLLGKLILLGVIFGIIGGCFAWSLKHLKKIMAEKLKNPIVRIAAIGAVLSILFLFLYNGRYSGLGTNLIEMCFDGGNILSADWVLKFVLTIITLAAGFQGGEVTPLFSIGACPGVVLAGIIGLPAAVTAALGYVCVFGGATNTFFAPILIGAEVFGFDYLPYFFVACAVSYAFNMNKSIYSLQY